MKLLTLDDLYIFCKSENLTHFSSNEKGHKLYVQVPTTFSKYESDEQTLYAYIKLYHLGRNRNSSNVTENASKHMNDTLAYKPLLANFTDVNGEWDFTSHDFTEWKDADGETHRDFQEKQIGCFTADKPYMEYDPEFDKTYAYAKVAIPREYTKAAEIIERKGGTKVSIELEILELSFSGKDDVLNIDDAVITGCTCLGVDPNTGKPIGEGMVDAHISLESFNEKNNSVFTQELINELKEFNKNFETLNFNNKQGGQDMNLFEELLAKYNVTEADVTFEYSDLSDEELKKAFAEAFDEAEGNEPSNVEPEGDEGTEPENPEGDEADDNGEGSEPDDNQIAEGDESEGTEDESENAENNYSLTLPNGDVKSFSLSLSDIQLALTDLVNATYSELDNDYYDCDIYEDESKVVMHSWWSGQAYRQSYKRKKDNFSLEGERVKVTRQWLSEDEEKMLNDMKANYSVIETKLAQYETKLAQYEAEPEKLELLNSDDYAGIKSTEEYAEISKRENYFELDKKDLAKKLDDIVLTYAKKNALNYSANELDAGKRVVGKLPIYTEQKVSNYGSLLKDI